MPDAVALEVGDDAAYASLGDADDAGSVGDADRRRVSVRFGVYLCLEREVIVEPLQRVRDGVVVESARSDLAIGEGVDDC